MKSFYIDNFGCSKNQTDAEEISTFLLGDGWEYSEDFNSASLIIVNSCGFIDAARRESINALIAWRKTFPEKKIMLAGCLAERYPDMLYDELQEADIIFGNANLSLVNEAARLALNKERKLIVPGERVFDPQPRKKIFGFPGTAYLKITEGCSNNCSFCAIPLIRGPIRSRKIKDIVREMEALLADGIFEICLIGQDIASFGVDLAGRSLLAELLKEISSVKGDFWLRLLYIHPDHFPLEILDLIGSDQRILPYFDLPFQHGSEKILNAMNRKGNAKSYLELAGKIRERLQDSVIRTTFLTGFPGESAEDFLLLKDFQRNLAADWLGVFNYSREEDTPAFSMKPRIPARKALARKEELMLAQESISRAALERWPGKRERVLIEEVIEGEKLAIARGRMNAPDVDGSVVVVGGDVKAGQIVNVRIVAVRGLDLEAEFIG